MFSSKSCSSLRVHILPWVPCVDSNLSATHLRESYCHRLSVFRLLFQAESSYLREFPLAPFQNRCSQNIGLLHKSGLLLSRPLFKSRKYCFAFLLQVWHHVCSALTKALVHEFLRKTFLVSFSFLVAFGFFFELGSMLYLFSSGGICLAQFLYLVS